MRDVFVVGRSKTDEEKDKEKAKGRRGVVVEKKKGGGGETAISEPSKKFEYIEKFIYYMLISWL